MVSVGNTDNLIVLINGSEIKNPKIEGASCLQVIKVQSDKVAIVIDCALVAKTEKSHTIEINGITGAYLNENVYYKPDLKTIHEGYKRRVGARRQSQSFKESNFE